MRTKHLLLAALAALMTASPGHATQPPPASQPPTDANVFIIREHAPPTVWAATIRVDGTPVASLGERTYTAFRLAPGTHRIRLRWPLLASQGGTEFDLDVEEGQSYYFAVYGQVPIVIATSSFVQTYGSGGSDLITLKADHGQALIARCCQFRAPRAERRER